jgi:hypothetical protein
MTAAITATASGGFMSMELWLAVVLGWKQFKLRHFRKVYAFPSIAVIALASAITYSIMWR